MKIKIFISFLFLVIILLVFFGIKNIQNKKSKISYLENKIIDIEVEKDNLPEKLGFLSFSLFDNKKINILKKKYSYTKYKTELLKFSKGLGGTGSSYLDYFENNLYLVSANGLIATTNINNFNKKEFRMKILKSNLKELLNQKLMHKYPAYGIKDVLISGKKIYVSFTEEIQKDCFNLSILVAEISNKNIQFNYFFKPKSCIKKNDESFFSIHQSGGRIIEIDENNLVFSIGEFRSRSLAQNPENINGKIIKINKNSGETKIISMGHRSSQGLSLDEETNFIYVSEHGPQGGDEINVIKDFSTTPNFGWPISSYGEHYGYPNKDNSKTYKAAPLNKSHEKYGFVEPDVYFVPSIGISEIININIENEKILIASALGYDLEEGDMSLHIFNIKNDNLQKYKIIPLNERVRDLIYIKEENIIFLFLETSTSIGLINLNKSNES